MTNLDDFFNAKPVVTETQVERNEFKPNPKKGQNGVFQAVVRFLPNPVDPANKSMIKKYVVYLKNPVSNKQMSVDCPSTIGQPDSIQNTFFALRNSSNPILQENSKMFSRKQQIASYVQVIDCKSDPTLVNKILIWRYGSKVEAKIQAEMNPPMGEGHNPFNLLTGRPFNVQVKEVGGYPNYDECAFFDLNINQSGMRIVSNNATGQPQIYVVTPETISTPQGKEMVFNYLKENAPDMTKYEYRDWTAETNQFVNECIQIYSNPQATIQAMSAASSVSTGAPIQSAPMTAQAAMTPQMPTFGTSVQSAPAAPQMPEFSMPSMGLNQAPSAVDPRGFNASSVSGLDGMLGTTPAPSAPSAPAMGMNLDDILAGQMIE